jgi:signal transduction histidine kinase
MLNDMTTQRADVVVGGSEAGTIVAPTAMPTVHRRSLVTAMTALIVTGSLVAATIGLHVTNPTTSETSWWLGNVLLAVALAPLGALVAARRPGNPVGWLLLVGGGSEALCGGGREYLVRGITGTTAPGWRWVGWLSDPAWLIGTVALAAVLLYFPGIQPFSRRGRPATLLLSVVTVFALTVGWATPDDISIRGRLFVNPADHVLPAGLRSPIAAIGFALVLGCVVCGGVTLVLRYRRSVGEERLQMKWITWAATIAALELATEFIPSNPISQLTAPTAVGVLVVAISVALLRHRLFDIDVVIERTLVFAILTAVVVGGYLLIVVGIGSALGDSPNVGLPLVATAIVALGFSPLRQRVQSAVDRWLFGARSNPYGLVTRLGRHLETADRHDDLTVLLETLLESLNVPRIALLDTNGDLMGAAGSSTSGESFRQSLLYAGEPVGVLALSPRSPGNAFSRRDRELIAGLAPQVGAAIHAVRLSADLQRSRRNLVAAKEDERRRLRRDLHDGLGPKLAAIGLKVDAAKTMTETRPADAQCLLGDVKGDLRDTLDDVRRLVYELRPPALDQLGLMGALRERAATLDSSDAGGGVRFVVEGEGNDTALSAAVEVAAYRIVTEAMTNVVRHANARCCRVKLDVTDRLVVEIRDDGDGLAQGWNRGVGTMSMSERALELGGVCRIASTVAGTVVTAEIPLHDIPADA